MSLSLRWGIRTDVGHVRPHNEDAAYAGPRLVVIADGMGGAVAGEVASRTVVDRLAALEDDDLGTDVVGALAAAVVGSNGDLGRLVADDPRLAGMGTTVTAMLADDDRLALVHVGDSRAYLFRDGVLTQVSRDHSLVQELVDAGEISEDEALVHPKRNIITRVLDGHGGLEPDVSVRTGKAGDRYLLCSDGLSDYVSHAAMTEAVAAPDPQQAADRLVELALAAGGVDNVTALVVDLVDDRPLGGHTFVGASADEEPHDAELPPLPGTAESGSGRGALGLGLHRRRQPEADTGRQRSRWLVPGVGLTVLVILGVAVLAGWLYVRSQWYVGPDGPNVALYRGVPGSVGSVHLQSVEQLGPTLASLTPEARRQVQQRITVDSESEGRRVLAEVEQGTLPTDGDPTDTPTESPTESPSGSSGATPTGTASTEPGGDASTSPGAAT